MIAGHPHRHNNSIGDTRAIRAVPPTWVSGLALRLFSVSARSPACARQTGWSTGRVEAFQICRSFLAQDQLASAVVDGRKKLIENIRPDAAVNLLRTEGARHRPYRHDSHRNMLQ